MLDHSPESQRRRARLRWGDLSPEERFWTHVDQTGPHWMWAGAVASRYGTFRWEGRMRGAHVVSYLISGRTLRDGENVLHSCDIPLCVNPDHLFSGTTYDNMQDMIQKGRQALGADLNHPSQDGQNNHNAKLSDSDVAEMRRLFDAGGATQADLMRRFHTTRANVHCIVRRKSRKEKS